MLGRLGERLASWGPYVWWGAVIFYICVRGLFYISIAQDRTQPINIDDSYTYIWQAARLDVCRQTCPAMEDLAPTFRVPSDDFKMNTSRVDKISRYLSVYAPLQEGTLLLIQRLTGMEWGAVFWVFIGIGVVLQAAGIGLLLRTLWGEWPAALGLVSAAFTVYNPQAQGLHYIVPSNVTLAIAMIVWACLIKDGRNAGRALIIGTALLVVSHPVGRLYALTALALYVVSGHWRLAWRECRVVIFALAIIGGYWIFARVSTAPPIDVTLPYFNPEFPTYFDLVGHQLVDALHKIGDSVKALTLFPSLPLNALILIGALILIPNRQRWRTWIFFVLALGMLVAAALTSLPAYPNEGNRRVILVLQIAFAGALGTLISWSLSRMRVVLAKPLRLTNRRRLAELLVVSSVAMLSCTTWLVRILDPISTNASAIQRLIDFENFDLKREDLTTILSESEATILYTNQVATLYGLSNGLHRFGAIYPSVLDIPPDLMQVDYILALQEEPTSDPLQELKSLYPDGAIEETFILVEGLKGDLRIYARNAE